MFIVFIILTIFPLTAQANDGAVPYSVEANLNENQINNDVSYFDLGMEPGEVLDLEVIVYNTSEEEISVNVANTTAGTNSNGLITYDGEGHDPHKSMQYPFNEISSLESETVVVPALDQKTVTIKVEAPEESFDGIILGGLHFSLEPEEAEVSEGVTIQNRFAYVLGVKIQENGNDSKVTPEIILNSVTPGIIDYRTGLQTEFSNTTPVIVSGVSFEGSVYEEESEEPIFTRTTEDFSIAPNSTFNFPIMYDNNRLEAGDYIFKGTASNEDHSWEFEETFEVTADTADEANDEAVELVEEENEWLIYVVIGLTAVILLLIVILLVVLRRKK